MSLAIGQRGVAIVGRIDEGPANGLVSNRIDHCAVNNIRLIVRLQSAQDLPCRDEQPARRMISENAWRSVVTRAGDH